MMYPFMTLNDDTEITHSEMKPDGRVKVYIETPDAKDGFHNAVCWLPQYQWKKIRGYSKVKMMKINKLVRKNMRQILSLSRERIRA